MSHNDGHALRQLLAGARAVQHGDFTHRVNLPESTDRWEVREMAESLNATLDMLGRFAGEVRRLTAEMGAEGRLGGQAEVAGAGGTWWTMLNAVNDLEDRLTGQVRNVSRVCSRLREGDASVEVTCDQCGGEFAELREHVNALVDQARSAAGAAT